MEIAQGERGESGDPSLCDDGLGVSPALRRRASALFDQQMWCWGQDVRHHGGDVLVRYGFCRWRTPPWTAPRFLVHSLWEFVTENVEIKVTLFDIPLADFPFIAGCTELLRRRVVQ
jgi:hypothetical protein